MDILLICPRYDILNLECLFVFMCGEVGEQMIKTLRIQNFRCFQDLSVKDLSPITLFGGRNNSGKSAILEAVFLNFGYRNPNIFFALAAGRNGNGNLQATPERIWDPLFFDFNQTNSFSFSVTRKNNVKSLLSMKKVADENTSLDINAGTVTGILKQGYDPQFLDRHFYALQYTNSIGKHKVQGRFSFENTQIRHVSISSKKQMEKLPFVKVSFYKNVYMVDNATIAEWVSKFILDGKKETLLDVLRVFDSRILDITTIVENNLPYVYIILTDNVKMPITYMGDGINKMLQLLLLVLTSPNGIVLLDEIENGFHYSVYPKVLKTLYEAALKMKCQLLITTHNLDILRQSALTMKELGQLSSLCYERISASPKGRNAYAFSGDDLEAALDAELEVR